MPKPTADSSGYAPDDSNDEPYEIELNGIDSRCPSIGVPVTAVACIWEQISAPAGDLSDELEFTQKPETTYQMGLTSCSDDSGVTAWAAGGGDPVDGGPGCMDFKRRTSSGGNPGSMPIIVGFGTVVDQTYNLYQFTVYECQFADCASQ